MRGGSAKFEDRSREGPGAACKDVGVEMKVVFRNTACLQSAPTCTESFRCPVNASATLQVDSASEQLLRVLRINRAPGTRSSPYPSRRFVLERRSRARGMPHTIRCLSSRSPNVAVQRSASNNSEEKEKDEKRNELGHLPTLVSEY